MRVNGAADTVPRLFAPSMNWTDEMAAPELAACALKVRLEPFESTVPGRGEVMVTMGPAVFEDKLTVEPIVEVPSISVMSSQPLICHRHEPPWFDSSLW